MRVIDSYREMFDQPQVMRTTTPIDVEFFQIGTTSSAKPTREEVVEFVDEAVEYAKKNGKEKALAEFTDQAGEFKRGELYIYAYDFSGNVLAHGGDPILVDQNLIDHEDPNGVKVIQELVEIAQNNGSGWLCAPFHRYG
ncbi:MAG: cache domain-containing protein [Actinobacteria bacterium]|nr:cache domain-containing protein [Actinomycetota bacterium]MBU4218405.1 cache domain-containing protein [Actinomycetota bacterium]MBU4358751.1 cache domain-containing protein [Actinomycetota bacterium]MBU4391013.1 cache domain-containing protein [Actinomycetota bacterium]MBU4401786.1 cache domain-containing protein [Actinomycetota bacterium]